MGNPPYYFTPSGSHQTDTTLSVAQGLVIPAGTTYVLIQALGANVRYRLDGVDPTASTGFQLKAGNPPVRIPVLTGMTIRVIQESSGASIEYQCIG